MEDPAQDFARSRAIAHSMDDFRLSLCVATCRRLPLFGARKGKERVTLPEESCASMTPIEVRA
jgi:hypothetical protein